MGVALLRPQSTDVDRFYCRRGGFVDAFATIHPLSLGVMPKAVASTEPDQLLTLEIGTRALEDAGYNQGRRPPRRTGIVVGRGLAGDDRHGAARGPREVRPSAARRRCAISSGIPDDALERVRAARPRRADLLRPRRRRRHRAQPGGLAPGQPFRPPRTGLRGGRRVRELAARPRPSVRAARTGLGGPHDRRRCPPPRTTRRSGRRSASSARCLAPARSGRSRPTPTGCSSGKASAWWCSSASTTPSPPGTGSTPSSRR